MARKQNKSQKFNFKPFSEQQRRLIHWWRPVAVPSVNNYVIADGSIRSGKTIAMIIGFLTWSQQMFKGQSFILAGKTMGALKKNVIRPMIQMLEAWGWPYDYIRSGTDARLEIGSNTYYLYGANTEASQDALQGLTAAGAYADEAALFPKSFIDQMIARCSVDGWKVWMNCNPAGPHHFIREEYLSETEMKRKKVYHLHFTMDDNLSISPKRKEEYKNAWPHGSVFYKRFILGLWVVAEGLVYQQFNNNIDKLLWCGSDEKLTGRWFISVDYGTVNPCSMGLWCLRNHDAIRIKEYYFDSRKEGYQKTDEEYYNDLERLAGNRYIEDIIIDPSAASFKEVIYRHNRFFVRNAKNDVINGIRTTSSMLNVGIVKIGSDCINSISEFGMYRWDEKSTEDKVIKENDHAMDDIRYFCHTVLSEEFEFEEYAKNG